MTLTGLPFTSALIFGQNFLAAPMSWLAVAGMDRFQQIFRKKQVKSILRHGVSLFFHHFANGAPWPGRIFLKDTSRGSGANKIYKHHSILRYFHCDSLTEKRFALTM
jgi:hypothetical protein